MNYIFQKQIRGVLVLRDLVDSEEFNDNRHLRPLYTLLCWLATVGTSNGSVALALAYVWSVTPEHVSE